MIDTRSDQGDDVSDTPGPHTWTWHGTAGHFVGAPSCCFHLHTTVGPYRVSSVGCYHAAGRGDEPQEIGLGRLYETMVFRNGPDGEPVGWSEVDSDGYNDEASAEAGHVAMCERWSIPEGAVAGVPAVDQGAGTK